METILTLLAGTLMGAIFFAAYMLGEWRGRQKAAEEAKAEKIEVNRENSKIVRDYNDFANYQG